MRRLSEEVVFLDTNVVMYAVVPSTLIVCPASK
jgi:hypothetical protein